MKKVVSATLLAGLLAAAAYAQVNMGDQKGSDTLPFTMTKVADFNLPWKIAFLPDGRMLITDKVGARPATATQAADPGVWLVTQSGQKTPVSGVPPVLYGGQGGLLGIFVGPHYATDHYVYLTYSEPNEGGSSLAMARARLNIGNGTASLEGLTVLWHDPAGGRGGQFGAQIVFAPDNTLFLSSGERQRMTPAQDPDSPLGKILHLTLDGKPAPGNPFAGQASAQTLPIIDPPSDTEKAKTAPVVRSFTYPASAPNQTRAETWTLGHRTPYGLAFAPNGQLWELEHGPRGGDKLNLIERGKNYGWPLYAYATNYNGVPIPSFDTAPASITKPVIYWNPVIAPGNLMFYKGNSFRGWDGSALASGMASQSLTRITFNGRGGATAVERWNMGKQVRDIEEGPDGSLWMVENNPQGSATGGLYHLTPK
ncbi:MAG: PQQ-dependent sugar dehydrogenase [Alphaproteobacteria bacterium]|nr:PQQ-dependent sugar dehydrogenase [Alphaproteobacteria bacterium]